MAAAVCRIKTAVSAHHEWTTLQSQSSGLSWFRTSDVSDDDSVTVALPWMLT